MSDSISLGFVEQPLMDEYESAYHDHSSEPHPHGRSDTSENPPRFLPFDPATKRSEALLSEDGRISRIVKGAPSAVAHLMSGDDFTASDVQRLADQGYRVLAVAAGPQDALRSVGLVALYDPPREDSQAVIGSLVNLGVRVVMVTGDNPATGQAVAARVGKQLTCRNIPIYFNIGEGTSCRRPRN